ncbi:MAG TPA: ribbon-helix-helix domain-containing protein [Chloroflexota bacterium]|nr:ribbon-helix-helix domain-containing protein [Chloroflexota bacterium]
MRTPTVRTTVALPKDLLKAADHAVAEGIARSRNDLLAMALRQLLAAHQRTIIDAGFAGMGSDLDYLAESATLDAGLDRSSWQTFRQADADNA